jgi:hypothetical protein
MIYLRMAWGALGAAGVVTKLLVAAGLMVTLLAAYGAWHHKVYQSGIDDAVARIAANDAKLVDRAFKARGKLKECQARGLGWNQTTGDCR